MLAAAFTIAKRGTAFGQIFGVKNCYCVYYIFTSLSLEIHAGRLEASLLPACAMRCSIFGSDCHVRAFTIT